MVNFDYDIPNKIITIPDSWGVDGTQVTIQELVDDIRDFEDENRPMGLPHIAEATGKQDLGGGVLVGITLRLLNGWRVAFEARLGPDWVTCNITGGNLVATDESGTSIYPVAPTAFVSVTLTASSSATLSELDAIQYASFDGGIWVDQVGGTAGTVYPTGTPQQPVLNIANAKDIADYRGFDTLFIVGDFTVSSGADISSYTVVGASQDKTTIYAEDGCTLDNCEFETAALSGNLGGSVVNFFDCRFDDTVYNLVNGYMRNCILAGTLKISGTTGEVVDILSCYSGVPGVNTPFIDFQGSYAQLGMRGYAGGITIQNLSHPSSNVSIDFLSGHGKIESTCTSGTVVVRGTAKCTNNSGDNCNVDVTQLRIPESDFQGKVHMDSIDGVSGTAYPIGTPTQPVSNLGEALTIMNTYNLETLYLHGTFTTAGTENLTGYCIISDSPLAGRINITPGTTTVNTKFELISLSGTMAGPVAIKDAYVYGLIDYAGAMKDTYLEGNIYCLDNNPAIIHGCFSKLDDGTLAGKQIIDVGNSLLSLEDHNGCVRIMNMTSGSHSHVNFNVGTVLIDSTCVSGSIRLGGIVKLTDNSGPNCTVYREGQIQADPSDFGGFVYIDTDNGESGTVFPVGTPSNPVDNSTDARTIADRYPITQYHIHGTITLDQEYDKWVFLNDSPDIAIVKVNGQSVNNASFNKVSISGQCSGNLYADHCNLIGVSDLNGSFYNCSWEGNIGIASGAQVNIIDSQGGSTTGADVLMSGACFASFLRTTDYFTVKNMTNASAYCSFVGNSAVTIDSSCVSGTIDIAGDTVLLADNSGPGATVRTLYTNAAKVWDESMDDHRTGGTFGSGMRFTFMTESGRWHRSGSQMIFYDNSGTTEIARFDLKKSDGSAAGESDDVYERTRV